MEDRKLRCSRRKFFAQAAALTLGSGLAPAGAGPAPVSSLSRPGLPGIRGRKPLALLATVYRPLSFACLLGERFLFGYPQGIGRRVPEFAIASLCIDQAPENDLSREVGREFGVRVTRSVADTLTGGSSRLAVDGVLLVGEHGNYPRNDLGQILYPRHEMLQEVVAVFRRTGQAVPVYLAKHLSYDPGRAQQMAAWAHDLGFPLMAGGSLPVTWRRPELELPLGTQIEEALVVGYGPIEVYGFHALEALQTMLERRRGGESGIRAVTCLTGSAVWKAADEGRWNWDLLDAALARSETAALGDVRRTVGIRGVAGMPAAPASAFLIEYCDGARGAALLLSGHVQDFTFAARLTGESEPASCLFVTPPPPGSREFDCLAGAVERFFRSGQSPYPLRRSLLVSCSLAAAMASHRRRGCRIETPELELPYSAAADGGFCRAGTLVS